MSDLHIDLASATAVTADLEALVADIKAAIDPAGPKGGKITVAEWATIVAGLGKLATDAAKVAG